MKTISKYILLAAVSLTLFSCSEWMNAEPEGATKTEGQKQEASTENPNAAAADVAAMYAQMIQLYAGLGDLGYSRHNDFGYASVCMEMESFGQDWVGQNIGYNWFSDSDWTSNRDNSLSTTYGLVAHFFWTNYYKYIHAANTVIASADRKNPGAISAALGQALALRAMCYMQLMQLYAPCINTADLNTTKCVPLVLDNMPAERQLNNPRVSLAVLDSLITSDLAEACGLLEGFVPTDKGYISEAVAHGLVARYALLKGDGKTAADEAALALSLSGATPLLMAEAGVPGFCSANAHNVLWANIITENNDVVQTSICNWPSHMCSFYTDGYTGVGAYRYIASDLYDEIPATDVRKGWWLNENLTSPLVAGSYALWTDFIDESMVYANVKFGTADGTITGTAGSACDWILMRAEELELIKAEGLAISGGDGKGALENFVKTYRNPNYVVKGDVVDEIWMQRRIELWGEGFAFFDILRLHKPIVRSNATNWPAAWIQDIPADHGCLLMRIPQAEIESNQGLSEEDAPFVAAPL